MILSPRLTKIINLTEQVKSYIDIGADHGLLSIALSERYKGAIIYATENKEGPYRNLVKNIKEANADVKCLYCDGLDGAPEANYVIIAGMGGKQIAKILKKGADYLKEYQPRLILEPQSDYQAVHEMLYKLQYQGIDERYIKERKKVYPIILAMHTGLLEVPTKEELQFGVFPLNNRDPILAELLLSNIKKLNGIPQAREKLNYFKQILVKYYA